MNYVKHLNLFGEEIKEIPCITGSGAPTIATEGAVGCFYMNTLNGKVYKCTAQSDDGYTWEEFGTGNGSSAIEINDDGYWVINGETTDVKAKGVTISSVTIWYAVSDSGTEIVNPSWKPLIPEVGKGQYLWTRMHVYYTDGHSALSFSVAYNGTDGKDGTDGKSAYEYAQEDGYEGTEAEYAEDINPDNINNNSVNFIATELAKRGQLKPEFANSIEECTDTTKLYVLPDGYIYAYVSTTETKEAYTNLLSSAMDATGAVLNGVGYLEEKRWGSSATTFDDYKDESGVTLVGMIPFKLGQTLRIKNIHLSGVTHLTYTTFRGFDKDRKQVVNGYANLQGYADLLAATTIDADNNMITLHPTSNVEGGLTDKMCYIAFTVYPTNGSENIIVTVDEEITDSTTTVTKTEWANTGHAFVTSENIDGKIVVDGNVEFVSNISECVDTDKLYVLPDGYIYAYMTTETSADDINTITERVTEGFLDDTRLSTSTGEPKGETGFVTTPLIDISNLSNWKIRLTGIQWSNTVDASAAADGFAYSVWNDNSKYIFGYTDHVGIGDDWFEAKNFKINIISTNEIEISTYNNSVNLPYTHVRLSGKGTSSDAIVEVIYEVATEPSVVSKWTNTGHAFIPADYEDRIVELEGNVSKLKVKSTDLDKRMYSFEASETVSVPTYVITEAERVANNVLSVRNAYSFVFGAISDIHSTGTDVNTLHAGQGLREIDKLTTLDACLNFGDGIDNYFENANADSFLHIHRCLHSVQRETPYIQMQGNHDQLKTDTTEDAQHKYFAYIGANNIGTVTDWDNRFRNYGYRDFPDQRMRVIYLNSVDVSEGENTDDCWLTAMQLSWLVNTALDFTDKNGWSFIVGCHHPLNWWYMDNLLAILNAYKGKASGSVTVDGTTVNYNFTNATAEFIAHFHGHLHNFRAETLGTNGVLSITIPNACFGRNNEYGTSSSYTDEIKANYGDADANGNQRQFNKTTGTAEDTAFNVVVVDREHRKIHCFNYGAGIDREISY